MYLVEFRREAGTDGPIVDREQQPPIREHDSAEESKRTTQWHKEECTTAHINHRSIGRIALLRSTHRRHISSRARSTCAACNRSPRMTLAIWWIGGRGLRSASTRRVSYQSTSRAPFSSRKGPHITCMNSQSSSSRISRPWRRYKRLRNLKFKTRSSNEWTPRASVTMDSKLNRRRQ